MSRATEPIARHELVAAALALGIERPDELSTEALTEAIQRTSEAGDGVQEPTSESGWFAVARHLVASVVEQGLNLPSAAKMLRTVGGTLLASGARARPPLPTVTLAQIYMTQGHDERARATLAQVLERQPDHPKARQLMAELERASEPSQPAASDAQADSAEARESAAAASSAATASSAAIASSAAAAAGAAATSAPPASPRDDLLVALVGESSARLAWQLGPVGEQLVADQGVEILVRLVRARPLGPEVSECRHPVSSATGVRSVHVPEGAALCAALCDVQGTAGVLGVAALFDAQGSALPGRTQWTRGANWTASDAAARGLAERLGVTV